MDIPYALLRHAVLNTWAKPHIDQQYLLQPNRITSIQGVRGLYRSPYRTFSVPDSTQRWVLYDVGHVPPQSLGFDHSLISWKTLQDVVEDDEVQIDAMYGHLHMPLNLIHVMRDDDGTLLFAVQYSELKDYILSGETFYVRLYSNAYFKTTEGQNLGGVKTGGGYLATETDISNVFVQYNALGLSTGTTWWYHNGYYVNRPNVDDVNVGDILCWFWDGSGTTQLDVSLHDMGDFTSTLDNRSKALFLVPEGITEDFIFYDDVDFYLCDYDDDGKLHGIYFDRRERTDVRQITLTDWSLDITRIYNLVSEHSDVLSLSTAFVRAFLRKSVTPDLNVMDSRYMKDLYSLDYGSRYHVLRGEVGTPNLWDAARLESSEFMTWLGLRGHELGLEALPGVYNYYGLQSVAQKPVKYDGYWALPTMASVGCLVIELDGNGDYLAQTLLTESTFTDHYYSENAAEDILVICGTIPTDITVMDLTSLRTNDPASGFEHDYMYQNASNEWVLATLGEDYTYDADTDTYSWDSTYYSAAKRKRSSQWFFTGELTVNRSDLGHPIDLFGGARPETGMGFGRIDVWINNKRCVRNLDYYFDGFTLYPLSLAYAPTSSFTLRYVVYGLPSDQESAETGFVYENMISYNGKVDLVKNRNHELVVAGQHRDMANIWHAEDYRGESLITFTTITNQSWVEGTTYQAGTLLTNSAAHYVAGEEVPQSNVFNVANWTRLWTSLPYYKQNTTDTHVYLYVDGDVLKERIVYQDGVRVTGAPAGNAETEVVYELKPGLPLSAEVSNGVPYMLANLPRQIPTHVAEAYTEGIDQAETDTNNLANFIGTLRDTYTLPDVMTIPKQHGVVSPFMSAVVQALVDGELTVTSGELSETKVDYMVRNYRDVLTIDQFYQGTFDSRFVAGYSHGYVSAVQLNIAEVNFLNKVNDIYFDGAINVTRDVVIVT